MPRSARRVDDHGAGVDELLGPQARLAEARHQTFGAPDVDLLVPGARVAGEVVIRGEVQDRGHLRAVALAELQEPRTDALLGGEVHVDRLDPGRGHGRPRPVERHDAVTAVEPQGHGGADPPARARDDHRATSIAHASPRENRVRNRARAPSVCKPDASRDPENGGGSARPLLRPLA